MVKLNLSKLLADRGMTQSELAHITGIRPSTICDIYNNNCTFIKLDNIDKICSALECDISELMRIKQTGSNFPLTNISFTLIEKSPLKCTQKSF